MSKVDVIIPAYNAAAFLPGAIESVIAQTEPDWRILLVNDGSTDATEAVVAPYRRQLGERLTYVHQENRGLPAARNTAIRHGEAPFLALLDADDRWLPGRLALSLESFAGRPEVGLSYGGVRLVDDAGRTIGEFTTSDMGRPGEMARRIYTRQVSLPCPTVTFRRAGLEATGLFDETLRASEDRDLWLRYAQRFEVAFVPQVLALYRSSADSMSGDLPRMLEAQRRFLAKHAGEPGCDPLARREALGKVYRDQSAGYARRGQLGTALRHAAHATLWTPWSGENLSNALWILRQAIRRS